MSVLYQDVKEYLPNNPTVNSKRFLNSSITFNRKATERINKWGYGILGDMAFCRLDTGSLNKITLNRLAMYS